MTKRNKYSKKAWLKPNRGSKNRNMAKHPLGAVELPWHYHQMVEKFDANMKEHQKTKIENTAKQEEGVILNIVYDDEKDVPKGPREFSYNMDQKD